jgi:hypothetical protein
VQGKPGTSYTNRTDLQRAEPVAVAPSAVYGAGVKERQAQQAVPLATPPQGPPPAAVPSAPQPGAGAPSPQGLPPVSGPGILPFLHPSNRPNEPVTAGLPTGPGPGPESLTGVGAIAVNQSAEQGSLKNLLGSLASAPTSSSAIRDLAAVAGGA